MEMSPEIDKLATALAKAQTTLANASKDASNPFFKSKYATLASVWDAWQAVGPVNGLGVVQTVDGDGGEFSVATILTHSSGQWIKCVTPILLGKKDMQSLGSAITYARRYGLSAMVGISPEDDDGAEASKSPQTNTAPAKQQPRKQETPRQAEIVANEKTNEMQAQAFTVKMHKELDACNTLEELTNYWKGDGLDERLAFIGDYSQKGMDGVIAKEKERRVFLGGHNGPA